MAADGDLIRNDLPSDADNFWVWCARCQKMHPYYTFTREDCDRVLSEGAKQLAAAIDAQILVLAFASVPWTRIE